MLETQRELRLPLERVLSWIRQEFDVSIPADAANVLILVEPDEHGRGYALGEGNATKAELSLRWLETKSIDYAVKEAKP